MNKVRPYLFLQWKGLPLHRTDHNTSSYSWAECVTTEVIENDIPLLLSKYTLKKANTYIDFANDKIILLNKEVPVKFTTSGHDCISIGKIVDDNHDQVLKSESVLFCDDVSRKLRSNCTVSLVILPVMNLLPY